MNKLENVQVKDVMIKCVKTIPKNKTIYEAVELMVKENIGSLIVTNEEVGDDKILSKRDVFGMLPIFFTLKELLKDTQGKNVSVTCCTFSDMVFIHEEASLQYALKKVTSNKTWRLIVFNQHNDIVGILSSADIMKFIHKNSIGTFELKIGQDTKYFGIDIKWSNGNTLEMNRQDEFVIKIDDVKEFIYKEKYNEKSEQSMMFLKVFSGKDKVTALYMDADPVQTNAREVDPSLNNLEDTLNWLLDTNYFCRQGDIGFYVCESIPNEAQEIPCEEYENHFIKPFHKRHLIEPKENCRFYVLGKDKYFINVKQKANIVHPEHPLVELPLGTIEVVCAKGEPLPKIIGFKEGEKVMV